MRLGPWEIVLILAAIVAAAVTARIVRSDNKNSTGKSGKAAAGIFGIVRKTGIALVLAGVVFLFAALSMFRWALEGYMWAFVAIAVGFVVLFLTRKRA